MQTENRKLIVVSWLVAKKHERNIANVNAETKWGVNWKKWYNNEESSRLNFQKVHWKPHRLF